MTARLVFLTGSKAGTAVELGDATITFGRQAGSTITFGPDEVLVSAEHASLLYRNGRYVLKDSGSRNGTFVNDEIIRERELREGDLIRLGPGGPAARFTLGGAAAAQATLDIRQLTENKAAELLKTRKPGGGALSTTRELVALTFQRMSTSTRRAIIAVAVFAAAGLAGVVLWQMRRETKIREQMVKVAFALDSMRAETAKDLSAAPVLPPPNPDIARRFPGVSQYSEGVALVVATYAYGQPGSKELLRYVLDPDGRVVTARFGSTGPVVQHVASATGFLIDTSASTAWLLTSRHITEPWSGSKELERIRATGLEVTPRLLDLRAWLPTAEAPFVAALHRASEHGDVAVLRLAGQPQARTLTLEAESVTVHVGDPLVAIGYPTRPRDLLAAASEADRAQIVAIAGDDDRRLVGELSHRHLIRPIITANDTATSGGSPVMNATRYRVVVIGGAQQRVPIALAWDIIPSHVKQALGLKPTANP